MRSARRGTVLLGVLLTCAALSSAPAAAAPSPPADVDPQEAAEAAERAVEQAPDSMERLVASQLADQPAEGAVTVTDQMRGDYDVDLLTSELHELFDTIDQPYQVVVTESVAGLNTDLAVIADEVDRDALYVKLDSKGSVETLERGISLDTDAARDAVTTQRNSGDRSILTTAEVFTETLTGESEAPAPDNLTSSGAGPQWDLSYAPNAARFGGIVGTVAGLGVVALVLGYRRFRRPVLFAVLGVVPVALVGAGTTLVYSADSERVATEGATAEANTSDPTYRADEPDYSDDPPYVPDTTRLEAASTALAESRVYVDPTSLNALEPAEAAALAEYAAEVDAFVAVAYLNSTDESDGDPTLFLHALQAVHGEAGTYILVEPSDVSARVEVEGFGVPVDSSDIFMDLIEIDTDDTAATAEATLDAVAGAPQSEGEPTPPTLPDADTPRAADSSMTAFLAPGMVVGLGITAVLGLAAWFFVPTRGAPASGARIPLGGTAPQRPSRAALEQILDEELDRLRSAIEGASKQGQRSRATDVLDAVLLLAAADPDLDDLVGIVVLCRRGVLLAAGDSKANSRLCQRNPLHGAASKSGRRGGGGSSSPRCQMCRDGNPGALKLSGTRESASFWSEHKFGVDPGATAQAIRRRLGVS